MDPTRKTVCFVNEGTWGATGLETQDRNVELYSDMLRPVADVEIVTNVTEAKKLLLTRPIDAVVFRSRGMEGAARRFKDAHPDTRVIVLSALPDARPMDTIIWVSKTTSFDSPADFARAVLG